MIPRAWREREVAVIGLARSGSAATRLFRTRGMAVYASDAYDTPALRQAAERLRALGADVEVGRHDTARICRAGVVIVSPGVEPGAPVLRAARTAGVPVHAEVEAGYLELEGTNFAAVTGTNGKTTTTALLALLLCEGGFRAIPAGNIGEPLSAVALADPPPEWIALEVSSFQLHDVHHLAPRIGVLTNLAPNHLDRYPSVAEYYADKARLFRHASPQSIWVLNGDQPEVSDMSRAVAGRHLAWSLERAADAWYDRARDRLMLGRSALVARAELALLGDHNVGNALAAALAAHAAGVSNEALARGLATFRPLPHRLEAIREVDGVLWINDSKATNLAATARAVAAVDRLAVLLLGGKHKGEPYTALAPTLSERGVTVVAYGEAAPLIEADLARLVRCERAASFDDAVARAEYLAHPGDAVLLAPACSSYDAFVSYEERGDRFRALVESL